MKINVLGCLKVYTIGLNSLIFVRLLYSDFEKLAMQTLGMENIFQRHLQGCI